MHACAIENIDSSGEGRGHRRHEDCEAPVFEFFNDEPGDESLLNRYLQRGGYIDPPANGEKDQSGRGTRAEWATHTRAKATQPSVGACLPLV